MLSVTTTSECPSRSCTAFTFAPARIRARRHPKAPRRLLPLIGILCEDDDNLVVEWSGAIAASRRPGAVEIAGRRATGALRRSYAASPCTSAYFFARRFPSSVSATGWLMLRGVPFGTFR